MFLVNSRLGLVSATLDAFKVNSNTSRVLLIPKLRRYFAEFLHHDSLDRLGILYLSTCVGLGYGRLAPNVEAFLGSTGSPYFPHTGSPSDLRLLRNGFAYPSSCVLGRAKP